MRLDSRDALAKRFTKPEGMVQLRERTRASLFRILGMAERTALKFLLSYDMAIGSTSSAFYRGLEIATLVHV